MGDKIHSCTYYDVLSYQKVFLSFGKRSKNNFGAPFDLYKIFAISFIFDLHEYFMHKSFSVCLFDIEEH